VISEEVDEEVSNANADIDKAEFNQRQHS